MQYYFAPLEGITGYIYRNAHHKFFPGIDKYFTPFLSPNQNHIFHKSDLRDILPKNNEGIPLVPQLLTKHPDDFIWAANYLSEIGYSEINLNLGCPSGTVVAKGKGSGFLAYPEKLDEFFYKIFSAVSCQVSVKTRLGIDDIQEFEHILEILNKYPIHELTIHPRLQKDYYKAPLHLDAFSEALSKANTHVCYNGDLSTVNSLDNFSRQFTDIDAVMIGRGLIANPSLLCEKTAKKQLLRSFHDTVYAEYCDIFGNRKNAMYRMKEYWFYHLNLYDNNATYAKKIKKATSPDDYEAAVNGIFRDLSLLENVTHIPKIK